MRRLGLLSHHAAEIGRGKREMNMSKYQASISKNSDGSFYALVVRVDHDGETHVLNGYKGRHFASLKAAEKSTAAYIAKVLA
jgi:demethoxyubiquinone hydroxylase (CLK1/Coq7/Cat5 family)